ncbi:MAG: LamG domain-containing protein [Sedimentisphaerales bacterium]|nr:LamG domain-containing protein [Sedimentisphaerales bacterium]MBN2843090.1 LamG domain-containing protein [Sedimentisphaerales bacterium]
MKKLFLLVLLSLSSLASAQAVTEGLIIHLDAGKLSGLIDGDEVATWSDQAQADSVNGTLNSVSGWTMPKYYRNGFNSRPVVRFGASTCLNTLPFTMPDVSKGLTVFMVATGDTTSETGERILQIGQVAGTAGSVLGVDLSTTVSGADAGSGGRFNNGKSLVAANNPMTSGFNIIAMQIAQGGNYGSLGYYVNDLNKETFNNSVNPNNIFNLLANDNELSVGTCRGTNGAYMTSDMYSGDVAEILVYNSQLTQVQMQQVMDELYVKYYKTTAWSPMPENNSPEYQGDVAGSGVDVTLSWNAGLDPYNTSVVNNDITGYYLYICQGDPNYGNVTPMKIEAGSPPVASASVTLSLDFDQVYSWRVDQSINGTLPSDPNTIVGPDWKFTTLPSIPVVVANPANAEAFSGDGPVSFNVEFSSISAISYQWYSSLDKSNATSGDDELIAGAESTTLTVVPNESASRYYYCLATNSGGSNASAPAYLTIKRMVLHLDMETADLSDVSGNGNNPVDETGLTTAQGLLVSKPTLAADTPLLAGGYSALFAVDVDGNYNRLTIPLDRDVDNDPATAEPAIFYSGYTLTMWAKTSIVDQAINTSLFNNNGPGSLDFQIELGNGNYRYFDNNVTVALGQIVPDEWVYLAVTCDAAGNVICYQNMAGDNIGQANSLHNEFGQFQIGTNRNGDKPYAGLIDDVKVWNYPLTFEQLSDEYNIASGKFGCYTRPEMDLNNDCIVNVADLAMLAGDWLECQRCPVNTCSE